MGYQKHQVPHKHCPPGYRHLFNCVTARTEFEARIELVEMFGHRKDMAAVLVRGHRRGIDVPGSKWIYETTGFTAFLPLNFKE